MREEIKQVREGLQHLYRAPFLEKPKVPPVQPILDELAIRADDVIVELGAGGGHFTSPIARQLETSAGQGIVFACDFSKSLVESLEQKAIAEGVDDHVRAVCLDEFKPRTLPFEDERVDSVLAVNFLHYLADPVPYLREVSRVLAPCGNLVVADWQKTSKTPPTDSASRRVTPDDLYPMMESAGLEANLLLELDGYEWAIRVIKPIVVFI
jgi:ubiquinone/menaquinone biosynthesis C-methylase UbiE